MKLTKFLTKLNEEVREASRSKNLSLACNCYLKMNALMDIFEPEELYSLLGDDKGLFLETSLLILTLPMEKNDKWVEESEDF